MSGMSGDVQGRIPQNSLMPAARFGFRLLFGYTKSLEDR